MVPPIWYAIAALIVTNLLTVAGCSEYRHQVKELKLEAKIGKAETERIIKEQQQITEDTKNGWQAALEYTRSDFAKRLRNARVPTLPPVSGPAGGVDGLATDALAVAAQCAETTLQLETLQDWVRQQKATK